MLAALGFACMLLASVLVIPFALFRALIGTGLQRRYWLYSAAAAGLPVLIIVVGAIHRVTGAVRETMIERLGDRASPLISAIETFDLDNGSPPSALTDLVPKYIDELPQTRMMGYARYDYERFPIDKRKHELVWYDLGPSDHRRSGSPETYPDGDPGHAILVLILGAEERVSDIIVDRLPQEHALKQFEREAWQSGQGRIAMAPDLMNSVIWRGMSLTDIWTVLGSPSGRRLLSPRWELLVKGAEDFLSGRSIDKLMFRPNGHYPESGFGLRVSRFKDWAYVVMPD